ncbi:MAG: response regulator, partial [Sedimentisphaerales bacterium]|nr:response regulator [Sedimentisphaerales bacterium]
MFGLQKKWILYGGDGAANDNCIAGVIAEAGFEGRRCGGVRECLCALESQRCDLLIDNAQRPAVEGMALLVEVGARHAGLPVIMLVEQNDVTTTVRAMKAGACDCLERPPARTRLRAAIDRALQAYEPQESPLSAPLSPMEKRVLELILQGRTS